MRYLNGAVYGIVLHIAGTSFSTHPGRFLALVVVLSLADTALHWRGASR